MMKNMMSTLRYRKKDGPSPFACAIYPNCFVFFKNCTFVICQFSKSVFRSNSIKTCKNLDFF